METAIGLMFAVSPIVLTVAWLMVVERRQRRVQSEIARQIAVTDVLHARLGAVVAPVVRRRGGTWQVSVAVPLENAAIVETVLAAVAEVFDDAAYKYELRLSRLVPLAPAVSASRPAHAARALSWT